MRKIVVTTLAAVLVLGVLAWWRSEATPERRHVSVMFSRTTSLYEGAQVKVLGVRVGTVDAIEVHGTQVRVDISYDPDVRLPADVSAVIVPPSVVGDRFVQLAPAYTGGATLPDGAELGIDRSGVPLELEDTYRALDQVARSLGPDGANEQGALSRLISAGADGLRGRGRLLNSTIREVADALGVLATSSGSIQGTTSNLARLNRRLAGSDATIRALVTNLVAVAAELHAQGPALSSAVTSLDDALARVADFARDNRTTLRDSVRDLTTVSTTLRAHTRELEEITDLAPVGLVNLMKTYVPRNWDPTDRGATNINGRTGSQNLHAALLQELDTQLSYTFGALCAALPAAAADRLTPFCAALEDVGGSVGRLLVEVYHGGSAPLDPSERELAAQRAGASR